MGLKTELQNFCQGPWDISNIHHSFKKAQSIPFLRVRSSCWPNVCPSEILRVQLLCCWVSSFLWDLFTLRKKKKKPQLYPLNQLCFIYLLSSPKNFHGCIFAQNKQCCCTAQLASIGADATLKPSIVRAVFSASPDILFKHPMCVFHRDTLGQTYRIIGPPGTGDNVPGSKWLTPFSHRSKVYQRRGIFPTMHWLCCAHSC